MGMKARRLKKKEREDAIQKIFLHPAVVGSALKSKSVRYCITCGAVFPVGAARTLWGVNHNTKEMPKGASSRYFIQALKHMEAGVLHLAVGNRREEVVV
jgi:hypothetical protein